ncbi:MAG: DUF1697 domain-containing protein [Phycisphaerales bacterium]
MIGIAFVRGINVGGRNPLPMATLSAICSDAGLTGVKTHIQSGNVVFEASTTVLRRAEAAIADGIEKARKFRPTVIVRTLPELRSILETRVFAGQNEMDGAKLLVMFLASPPRPAVAKVVDSMAHGDERLRLMGREVFMHLPRGVGQTRINFPAMERTLGPGTVRNWNTIQKMVALGEGVEQHPAGPAPGRTRPKKPKISDLPAPMTGRSAPRRAKR